MENRSFRDILEEFIAQNDPHRSEGQDLSNSVAAEPMAFFTWQAPHLNMLKRNAYAQASNRKQSSRNNRTSRVQTKQPEIVFAIGNLNAADRADIQLLIVLGADFKDGISLQRLKKAHRRLLQTLHPDRLDKSLSSTERSLRQEKFLILQAAYERLSHSLGRSALGM